MSFGTAKGFMALNDSTEPALSRDQASTADELKRAEAIPLGKHSFRLVGAAGFDPQENSGNKMDVKGLLIKTTKMP